MTETVSYEITLTHARLAELLDVPVAAVPGTTGRRRPLERHRPGRGQLRPARRDRLRHLPRGQRGPQLGSPGRQRDRPSPARPADHRPGRDHRRLLADAADHSERRARALIAQGMDEDAAIEQAADEAILFTRRVAQMARQGRTIVELVAAYDGNTYRLLRDLGDHLAASLAYVDRPTVEAHLERTLSDAEWAATNDQFTALDFDEHVGDHGSFRTDWIESVLEKAGVPGYGYTADGQRRRTSPAQSATGGAAA